MKKSYINFLGKTIVQKIRNNIIFKTLAILSSVVSLKILFFIVPLAFLEQGCTSTSIREEKASKEAAKSIEPYIDTDIYIPRLVLIKETEEADAEWQRQNKELAEKRMPIQKQIDTIKEYYNENEVLCYEYQTTGILLGGFAKRENITDKEYYVQYSSDKTTELEILLDTRLEDNYKVYNYLSDESYRKGEITVEQLIARRKKSKVYKIITVKEYFDILDRNLALLNTQLNNLQPEAKTGTQIIAEKLQAEGKYGWLIDGIWYPAETGKMLLAMKDYRNYGYIENYHNRTFTLKDSYVVDGQKLNRDKEINDSITLYNLHNKRGNKIVRDDTAVKPDIEVVYDNDIGNGGHCVGVSNFDKRRLVKLGLSAPTRAFAHEIFHATGTDEGVFEDLEFYFTGNKTLGKFLPRILGGKYSLLFMTHGIGTQFDYDYNDFCNSDFSYGKVVKIEKNNLAYLARKDMVKYNLLKNYKRDPSLKPLTEEEQKWINENQVKELDICKEWEGMSTGKYQDGMSDYGYWMLSDCINTQYVTNIKNLEMPKDIPEKYKKQVEKYNVFPKGLPKN